MSERLLLERERLGLNRSEAADRLGVGRAAYTHYESGRSTPDVTLLAKAHELGMDAWWIMSGIPHAESALDAVDLDVLKSVILAVSDFNKAKKLDLASQDENELIRTLYRQQIQLQAAKAVAMPAAKRKGAA